MTKLDLYAPHRDAMQAEREQHDGPQHWRSLDHKHDTAASRVYVEQEFPHGSALPPAELEGSSGFQRRDALKLMGASLALAGVGTACVRRPETEILPYTKQPEHEIPGLARYFASSYPGPNGAVGIIVEAHEGRPTKIEGNPDHAASGGRASVHMQASVLELYDPDRSQSPKKAGAASSWSAWDSEGAPALQKKFGANGGSGLALLTDASGGPTFERVQKLFAARYPSAKLYSYDLLRADNALVGTELVFGAGARASYALEGAQVVLSLDSDFLHDGPEHLKNAFGFSRGRSFEKIGSGADAGKMNRLYAVESAFTATGGCADHRLRVRSSEIAGFAGALARELAQLGAPIDGLAKIQSAFKSSDEKFLPALAKDLVANKGRAVIVVGPQQPAAVHALALLLNKALGAFESVVSVTRPSAGDGAAHVGSVDSLAALTKGLESGSVDTLVILGANPAYASPGTLGFGAALGKAKEVIHLGLYEDETGAKASWHLPMAHPLETWGDASSWTGLYSPIQPLIQPLYQGRSAIELLAQLAGVDAFGGRGLVEATFLASSQGGLPDSWKKTLHDGVADLGTRSPVDPGTAAIEPTNGALSTLKSADGDDVELLFTPGFTVLDGRYANLGWLQECPDPMSKLCWDNAALLSAALAKKLGVQSGMESNLYVADVLRLELEGRSVEIPAFVLPGIEPNTIVLSLGYGRTAAGEIGNGIGVDVFPLLPADGARFARGAKVSKTGKRQAILSTQDHFSVEGKPFVETETLTMGGRPLAVEGTVALYAKEPTFAQDAANLPKKLQEKNLPAAASKPLAGLQANSVDVTQQPWTYDGQAWGMSIDLTACTSCQACVVACQSENNIPVVGREGVEFGRELHWIRIDRYFTGDVDNPRATSQPVACMHCENAPCEPVCPVAATVHDEEGLNSMVYNRCIGTRYCANNCPYKVRRFNYFDYSHSANLYLEPQLARRQKTLKMLRNPDVTVRYRGVMEKCTYCTQRIQLAKYEAKKRGEDPRNLPDGAVTPACVQTCPTNAIVFGSVNGKKADGSPSEVARRKSSDRNYEMLSELNVRPRTTFLAKLRNANPELV